MKSMNQYINDFRNPCNEVGKWKSAGKFIYFTNWLSGAVFLEKLLVCFVRFSARHIRF